jgi:hypothetical protein
MLPEPDRLPERSLEATRGRFESSAQIVEVDAEGILRASSKSGVPIDIDAAKEIIRQIGAGSGGARRPILVDFTSTPSISREARTYFAGPETAKVESAAALLVTSPLARALGNFFMGFNKGYIPVRLFTSEAEALAWLRGFLP